MLCHVFYCPHHLHKCWQTDFGRDTCLAPEGFKRSISGPQPKKVVHHCYKSSNTATCRQRRAQGFVSGVAGIIPVAPEFMPWHISRPFTWTFVYGSRDSDTRPLFHPPTSSFSFSSSSFTLSSSSSLLQSLVIYIVFPHRIPLFLLFLFIFLLSLIILYL